MEQLCVETFEENNTVVVFRFSNNIVGWEAANTLIGERYDESIRTILLDSIARICIPSKEGFMTIIQLRNAVLEDCVLTQHNLSIQDLGKFMAFFIENNSLEGFDIKIVSRIKGFIYSGLDFGVTPTA